MSVVKWCESALIGISVLVGLASPLDPAHRPLVTKHPVGTTAAANGFVEYLPPHYATKSKSPVLIAWHGRGENGPGTKRSLDQLNDNGVTKLLHEGRWDESRPFVVLAPQHDGGGCPQAAEVADFIHFAKVHYHVDPQRVYLTGLSCGARGIADYLAHEGGKEIAAAVLISGDLSPAWAARECSLARDLPLWIIHGDRDDIVPNIGDVKTAGHLQACAHRKEIKFDSYGGVGHDAWTYGYDVSDHDVFAWMRQFKRDEARTATAH